MLSTLDSTDANQTASIIEFEENSDSKSQSDYLLEPAEQFSQLTTQNFDKLITSLSANSQMRQAIDLACKAIVAGDVVLNSTHLCRRFQYSDTMKLEGLTVDKLLPLNVMVKLAIEDNVFHSGYIFAIDNISDRLEFTMGDNDINGYKTLQVKFPFSRSDKNQLGMNFLDNKLIYIDYAKQVVTLSECQDGKSECITFSSSYSGILQRGIKVAFDILCLILFLALILGTLITYDKYTNEEEYAKE